MFSWKTLEEMREAAEKAGAQLPLAEDTSCLRQSWQAGTHAVPNRIVIYGGLRQRGGRQPR